MPFAVPRAGLGRGGCPSEPGGYDEVDYPYCKARSRDKIIFFGFPLRCVGKGNWRRERKGRESDYFFSREKGV